MEWEIRLLEPEEINVKPKQVISRNNRVYVMLLLYKDSRCDMARLDEVFNGRWQRKHEIIGDGLYCTISIWDPDIGQWISKQDVGTESDVEKQKGEASDSFKRAGTNWGIGRELYTAPRIFVDLREGEYYTAGGKEKISPSVRFHVKEIKYENRIISKLIIADQKGKNRYSYIIKKEEKKAQQGESPGKKSDGKFLSRDQAKALIRTCRDMGIEQYVTVALKNRGLAGLSELETEKLEEFVQEVESVAKGREE